MESFQEFIDWHKSFFYKAEPVSFFRAILRWYLSIEDNSIVKWRNENQGRNENQDIEKWVYNIKRKN